MCAGRIRGGYDWDDGRLTKAVIHSKSGLPCRVVYGDQTWEFNTKAGKSYPLTLAQKIDPRGAQHKGSEILFQADSRVFARVKQQKVINTNERSHDSPHGDRM